MTIRSLLLRVRGFLRRGAMDRRLEEELRFHLDMEAGKNRNRGMGFEEASWAAQRAFGGTQQIKEIHRETRGLPMLETASKDLQYALRAIRRSPGFALVAVLSLALGIGANTAIFTLIDAVMLRSLPVRSPNELVAVGDASRPNALWVGGPMSEIFSYPMYQRLRDQQRSFSGLLASGKAGRTDVTVGGNSPEEARSRLVSDNYFEVLGVPPVLGRTFSAETNPSIVISYAYWMDRFNGSKNVLGSTLNINGSPFNVIGVTPRQFTGEVVGSPTDIWIPLSMQSQVNLGDSRTANRDSNWLLCIGRLKPGVGVETARAELTGLVRNALIDYEGAARSPDKIREIRNQRVYVEPGGKGFSWIRTHDSSLLFTLMAMVSLVLLIACANVANLLLARGTSRQKEISVRLALGASSGRIVRQFLTESVLLAFIAGVAGIVLAGWGSRALSALASRAAGQNPIPFEVDLAPQAAVLAFTAVVSALTAILFGLVPALRSTRIDVTPALKQNARSFSHGGWKLGKVLVITQLVLSVTLLMAAGLFVRSMVHLNSLDIGYSRRNLVVLGTDLATSGVPPSERPLVAAMMMEHLRSLPGVAGGTFSKNGIFSGTDSSTDAIQVDGFIPARKEDSTSNFDEVGPHFFQVVGAPILAGRDFDEHDRAGTPSVAILNSTMARFYFGKQNPLGRSFRNGGDRFTIVGVVRDIKAHRLKGQVERRCYVPLLQDIDSLSTVNFEIRTRVEAASMLSAIRRDVVSFDRNLKISSLEPATLLIDQSISGDRLIATLSGFFAVLVLLLAANGLYGVISYTTSRRANEIGLRIALGASRAEVIRMILRETLMLIGVGLAAGLPVALASARWIAATLTGVSTNDPVTVAAVTLVLLIVGVAAGLIPAARASRIDPMAALRQE